MAILGDSVVKDVKKLANRKDQGTERSKNNGLMLSRGYRKLHEALYTTYD